MLLNSIRQWSHMQPDTVLVLDFRHAVHFEYRPGVVLKPFVKLEAWRGTLGVPFVDHCSLCNHSNTDQHKLIGIVVLIIIKSNEIGSQWNLAWVFLPPDATQSAVIPQCVAYLSVCPWRSGAVITVKAGILGKKVFTTKHCEPLWFFVIRISTLSWLRKYGGRVHIRTSDLYFLTLVRYQFFYITYITMLANILSKHESCDIAKMTSRDAPYITAISPWFYSRLSTTLHRFDSKRI